MAYASMLSIIAAPAGANALEPTAPVLTATQRRAKAEREAADADLLAMVERRRALLAARAAAAAPIAATPQEIPSRAAVRDAAPKKAPARRRAPAATAAKPRARKA